VINLSLGSEADTPFLREVVRSASQANVLLISAAGNIPVTTPFYPAAYPEVRAVTAIEQGQIAPYASRGNFVSLGGPSMNFIEFGSQSYNVQGTSVSSAYVSGAAAGFMEMHRANSTQAGSFLQNNFGLGGR
jgi:subtilisin family serine protease